MDHYFKICHAKEEISRLNVEIQHVTTYLRDEDCYLHACKAQVQEFNPQLAHQIALHQMEHSRFNAHHLSHLIKISKLPGFTGNILPGESIDTGRGASTSNPIIQPPVIVHDDTDQVVVRVEEDSVEDLEEDQDADDSDEEVSRAVYDILCMSDT